MTKPGKDRCQGQRKPTRAPNNGWHFPSLTFPFTYFDLHREFHHKNKPLPAFLWCHWSLCLLDWPTPLWVQEPVPEKQKLIIEFKVSWSTCFLTNLKFIRRFNSSYQVFSKHLLCALQHSFMWGRIINVIQSLTNLLRRKVCDPTNQKRSRCSNMWCSRRAARSRLEEVRSFVELLLLKKTIPGKATTRARSNTTEDNNIS